MGVLLATTTLLLLGAVPAPPSYGELLRLGIRARIEAPVSGDLVVAGELICPAEPVRRFYQRRDHRATWLDLTSGRLLPAANELLDQISDVGRHGLDPRDYHADTLLPLLWLAGTPSLPATGFSLAAEVDLLLSDAFLQLASHLASGRVDPQTFDTDCEPTPSEVDPVAVLEDALAGTGVAESLRRLEPAHPGYRRLMSALEALRSAVGGGAWPSIQPGPTLEPGAEDMTAVAVLRARLAASGELAGAEATVVYDDVLQQAVRSFQARHGLEPDARVGRRTWAALAVSAAERVRQVELNLERWRWLPRELGERFILVNAAGFWVSVEESGREVLRMGAAVGREARRTPVFSSEVRQVVLAPWWIVPRNIAVADILPKVQADPSYLIRNGFLVHRQGEPAAPVDPATIDWQNLGRNQFPYVLRQAPGPQNPLGGVKFMMPNRFDVYLHDTPSRGVFQRFDRDVSSGCVRLERALELAAYLLADDPSWTADRIAATVAGGRERVVTLHRPVPVHLQYWTGWVDTDGALQLREDLYGRDARLERALAERAEVRRRAVEAIAVRASSSVSSGSGSV